MQTLTAERLREVLDYDPERGVFTWLERGPGRSLSREPGGLTPRGYRFIMIDGERIYAHTLAWLYVHGRWPAEHVNHKNGNLSDNRLCNLREATRAEISWSARPRRDSRSPLKGAQTFEGRWRSGIVINGKTIHLGLFDTPEEAHAAYCEAARLYHGAFARVA